MSEIEARNPVSPFDAIMGEDGRWSARDLQGLMGYSSWQKFQVPLKRAATTARNQGRVVEDEFSQVTQLTRSVNQGQQEKTDYRLSRFAAYLLAMNGDPNKAEVASAQAYFATKTREAELAEQTTKSPPLHSRLLATTEMVARFYEVGVEAVKSLVKDHREELENSGYRVLRGQGYKDFVRSFEDPATLSLHPKARSVALLNRKAILNVGMLVWLHTDDEGPRAKHKQPRGKPSGLLC